MLTYISNRSLLFIVLTTIIILCLSLSSFFSSSSISLSSFFSSSSIETQYSSILGPNIDKLPTQDQAIQLFQLWKKGHGKVYNDLEEMAKKFDIFVSNLKYITESNAKRESSDDSFYGLNNFADWSPEEFKEHYLHKIDTPTNNIIEMHDEMHDDDNISALPASIDWRSRGAVTPIKSQNPCGCCWAFSAVGAVEGIIKIKGGMLNSLSPQELVDCDRVSHGCSGGRADNAFHWIKTNGGIGFETDYRYSYSKIEGTCKASKTPKRVKIDGYGVVTSGSESSMMSATANQPISVYLWASQDFQYLKGNKIYNGPECDASTSINHAVLIVGYGSENGKNYWIVKNSWGTGWGNNGYVRIQKNTGKRYGVCAINVYGFYPIKY